MNQPIKIKVSESGMEGQAVCLYKDSASEVNPVYPLTTAQTPNSIVEAKMVEQRVSKLGGNDWYTIDKEHSKCVPSMLKRIAYEVIEQTTTKENSPQSDVSVQELSEYSEFLINLYPYDEDNDTWRHAMQERRAFIAGHNHAIKSKQLVRLEDVVKIVKEFDFGVGPSPNRSGLIERLKTLNDNGKDR